MIEAATEPELKKALETHLQETKGHLARVDEVLIQANRLVEPKHCKGIGALIAEGEDLIKDATDESVRDRADRME